MIEELIREVSLLYLMLTNKEYLYVGVKLGGGFGCSDHDRVEIRILRAGEKWWDRLHPLQLWRWCKVIDTPDVFGAIQRDFRGLENWAGMNLMKFKGKCQILFLERNNHKHAGRLPVGKELCRVRPCGLGSYWVEPKPRQWWSLAAKEANIILGCIV